MDGVLNFRDLADATAESSGVKLAPGRVFRTATPGKASAEDAATILNDLRVARLLDLRSSDEWEPEAGPVQEAFEIRPFSRLSRYSSTDDASAHEAFELAVADDVSAGRLVRYHTPLLDYDRYYGEILERMSPFEKVKAAVFTARPNVIHLVSSRLLSSPLVSLTPVLMTQSVDGKHCSASTIDRETW